MCFSFSENPLLISENGLTLKIHNKSIGAPKMMKPIS
jgi:hypothetical protein